MDYHNQEISYSDLKKNFTLLRGEYRPVPFWHLDGDIADEDEISILLSAYKRCGYGGVALLPVRETTPKFGTSEYEAAYGKILEKAQKNEMSVIYYDDQDFPSGWAAGELAREHPEALARQLCRKTLDCVSGTRSKFRAVTGVTTMSIVAVEEDSRQVVDLRDYLEETEDGKLLCLWDVPEGNWQIQQYYCVVEKDEQFVNYLSYDASMTFVNLTYKRFTDRFAEFIGDTVKLTFYDDIQFRTTNRRMWDEHFNTFFKERYGYDPAPYYPALYEEIGPDTDHFRAQLIHCRAQMLAEGFFRAVSDFTGAHGLLCTGHVAEPKTAGASWLFGDAMLIHQNAGAVGLDLVHRYMYGFNGLKIASSAANNYDRRLVCCEIYGNYDRLNENLLYREAMNAFVRGANYLIPHTLWLSGQPRIPHEVSHRNPAFMDVIREVNDYITRCQTLLRGGRHISDIAMLYPIYSLAGQTTLYEAPVRGWEFSRTPGNADYINLINCIMNYCGYDLTVIHPDVLHSRCTAMNGALHLKNETNFEQYKVLIIPGSSMISIHSLRLAKKFFESGGKILVTGHLPFRAYEFNPDEQGQNAYDQEAADIIEELFGVRQEEIDGFRVSYEQTNAAGGRAIYLLPGQAAADGTDSVDSPLIRQALQSFDIPFDVVADDMPRIPDSSIMNLPLPMMNHFHPEDTVGGVFNYLHRRLGGCDIYFFANSTNRNYESTVNLRGRFSQCEEWDPHTGKIRKLTVSHYTMQGEEYTTLQLKLPSSLSTFIIARP